MADLAALWSAERVLPLAPDPASAKAGQGLANTRKWTALGRDELSLWGLCQGSGKAPYQTQIDLSEPAFKCTCPSRKFPCKHGLGLFLLLCQEPAAFARASAPAWVEEWRANRAKRAEKKDKKEKSEAAAEDPEAQGRREADKARRAGNREARVAAGTHELDLWLRDVMRRGLADVQRESYRFWEAMAARMVDSQAPGLARLLREMPGAVAKGPGWEDRLLECLGVLYLAVQGYQRIQSLTPAAQEDLRTLIGWTQDQEQILSQPTVTDEWFVMGQSQETEERLRVQRTWLWGTKTEQAALVLDFAHGSAPLDVSLTPGTKFKGSVAYFPSAFPLRALVREHATFMAVDRWLGKESVRAALDACAEVLAQNPWAGRLPVNLAAVTPLLDGERWLVRDAHGDLLPLNVPPLTGWSLYSFSGGASVGLFGEWEDYALRPLGAWNEQGYLSLKGRP